MVQARLSPDLIARFASITGPAHALVDDGQHHGGAALAGLIAASALGLQALKRGQVTLEAGQEQVIALHGVQHTQRRGAQPWYR